MILPTLEEVRTGTSIYGSAIKTRPHDELVLAQMPYPLIPSWNGRQRIKRLACHRLIKDDLIALFQDILDTYGIEDIHRLNLDITAGCHSYRKTRGGSSLSAHSWAIAFDLSPALNGNRTKWADSQFSKPEYKEFMQLVYKHNFQSYGIEKGRDGMHYERSATKC